MATLWQRSRRGGERSITTVDDYIEAVTAAGLWAQPVSGVTQTLPGQGVERAPAGFADLARQYMGSSSVVFACMLARLSVFSATRFQYQRFRSGRPSELYGDQSLGLLERPWEGGTTGDLLARMITDADLAGNSYWVVRGGELVRLRPDWVDIALVPRTVLMPDDRTFGTLGWRKAGYVYYEDGIRDDRGVPLLPDEVCHFAPIPDPLASYRGMSWLTPLIRDITADTAMTRHKARFMSNAATPNMVIKHAPQVTPEQARKFKLALDAEYAGADNAGKTMHLGGGADLTVVGKDFQQIDLRAVQGAGETRIAAAAGTPPIIVGLSEGLQAATYCGTYDQAVWTTRGIVKLGEIAVGDTVWSFVGSRIASRKVVWHAQTGTKPVYTVRTKNRTIRFTDNHPILVRVPGNPKGANAERSARVEWRRVDELRVGDRIVQAQRLPDQGLTSLPNGSPASTDVLQWLGAYTGDGCLNGDSGVRMCIPVDDRARARYAELATGLFTKRLAWQRPGRRANDGLTDEMVRLRGEGLTFRQIVETMGLDLHPMSVRDRVQIATRTFEAPTAPVVLGESRNAFQFHSRHAVQWHHDMGVTGTAKTKRVPPWVYELREDLRLAYLAGIVDTDGSVGRDGRLAVQFASRELVEDVRMLLISCGIACSNIARVEFKASVLPNPGAQEVYEAWRFVASSAVEVARIPFTDPLYRERVDAHQHRHRPGGGDAQKAGLHEDLGFYAVRSIEIGPAEPVFDIAVEDGHSFLVDGVVVHNSNYGQARRRFADGTMHPLWGNAAGSLERIRPAPAGSRLWHDPRDVPFLREDSKDAAEIAGIQSRTIRTLVDGGYDPESVIRAVTAGDFGLLVHTGFLSVQLQRPGEGSASADAPAALDDAPDDRALPAARLEIARG